MGKDLYDAYPAAGAVFDKADEVLGFSLSKLCFEGPETELKNTKNCQPAIFTVSIAALEAFKSGVRSRELGVPKFVAGLSLGEYSALVAAGAISFNDAVYLLNKRGQFMEEAAAEKPGIMLSIVGLELNQVKEICAKANTEVANLNCPGQTVISGGVAQIEEAAKLAEALGAKRAIQLEVSGAFHSSFMQSAAVKLAAELEEIKIDPAAIPVVANINASPATSAKEIKENLVRQVAGSVLWEDSMRFMLKNGVNKFYEFGPGKVLKALMRRIDPAAEVVSIEKKQDLDNLS